MKNKKIICVVAALTLIVFVAGCQENSRLSAFRQIKIGQTEMGLSKNLGKPDTYSPYAWEYDESFYKVKIPVSEGLVTGKPIFESLNREQQNLYLEAYVW